MRISLLIAFVAFCCTLVTSAPDEEPKRPSTGALGLSNGLTWGDWGPKEFCPDGSFVHAFDTKYETFSSSDETGLNAVKLFCSTPGHHDTGYITSVLGEYGEWQGMRVCEEGFVTGMRGQVVPEQGVFTDDLAVVNLELDCNYGNGTLVGVENPSELGVWSAKVNCEAGSAVCGLEVRYEKPNVGDDSGVTDLVLFCCAV
ncbi:vitelline membrane outer layer protein 1-like [Penaeus japonicus]|uniref:vitelline membrane outer layer protein 1-like n=1 Tax=Penaeus japonicus TaxID=27405 RepID=UPI001C71331D|nr:vitelline membrane outer layer protein 1-like [Penaeus japonicus]